MQPLPARLPSRQQRLRYPVKSCRKQIEVARSLCNQPVNCRLQVHDALVQAAPHRAGTDPQIVLTELHLEKLDSSPITSQNSRVTLCQAKNEVIDTLLPTGDGISHLQKDGVLRQPRK